MGKEDYHQELRTKLNVFIVANWETLHQWVRPEDQSQYPTAKAYVRGRGADWARELEISAFAQMTQCDVFTYAGDQWTATRASGHGGIPSTNGFYIYNEDSVHYRAVNCA